MYTSEELGVAGVPVGTVLRVIQFKVHTAPKENCFNITVKCGKGNGTQLLAPVPQSVRFP